MFGTKARESIKSIRKKGNTPWEPHLNPLNRIPALRRYHSLIHHTLTANTKTELKEQQQKALESPLEANLTFITVRNRDTTSSHGISMMEIKKLKMGKTFQGVK